MASHIIPNDVVPSQSIPMGSSSLVSLAGTTIRLNGSRSGITVNGATIRIPDLLASNGIIHAVGDLLVGSIPRPVPRPVPRPAPAPKMSKGGYYYPRPAMRWNMMMTNKMYPPTTKKPEDVFFPRSSGKMMMRG